MDRRLEHAHFAPFDPGMKLKLLAYAATAAMVPGRF